MMVGMVMFIALQSSDTSGLGVSEPILILRSEVGQNDRLHASCDDRLSFFWNEEEVKTMLVTALERERQQIFQNGLREGEQKDKQEGRIETAKAMLAKGMEMTLISEITNLPEAQLLELKDGLSSIKK